MMKKLNVGCGQFPKEGFVNVDISPLSPADVIHDLEQIPYPFPDNSFEHIEAEHVLEHLSCPFQVMAELYRIVRPGGSMHIRVPHFSRGFTHAEHKRGFDVTFPLYFNKDFLGGYTGTPLLHRKTALHWFAQRTLMKKILNPFVYYLLTGIGFVLDRIAAFSPFFCSRVWCFWVGGFYEIEFIFEKPVNEFSE